MKNLFACLMLLSFSYKNFLLENSYCNVDMKKKLGVLSHLKKLGNVIYDCKNHGRWN